MDCETEFNTLVSLYQGVMHDLKQTYPAWENVSQKALKLSNQLKGTVLCFNAFVDAVQAVGDAANNLKGGTRDMGACLTRMCMRQRSVENRLRAFADALTDELVVTIQNKCSFWKQRTTEMDRRASKFSRKARSRKGAVDSTSLVEQRRICRALLMEQRKQLSFFVGSLLPVFNSELCILDEGAHVRQITEHLQNTAQALDSASVVDTILDDIHQGSDYSWQSCISSNANRTSQTYSSEEGFTRVSSPTPSTFTWPTAVENSCVRGTGFVGSHTISVVEAPRRGTVNPHLFSPPSPNLFLNKKTLLQKRTASTSSTTSSTIPDFIEPLPDQIQMPLSYQNGGSQYASSTSLSRDSTLRRMQRPSSFVCDETSGTLRILPMSKSRMQCSSDKDSIGPCDAAFESSSLIAQTIQQIDKLGSELDSYCSAPPQSATQSHVRLRSGINNFYQKLDILASNCRPPPPPERRNSTITAATPTAPSVAEVRASSGTSSDYASSVISNDFSRDHCGFRFP
uniref:IMD domain-containing protein n=1 Tax=Syphacia muris TaxID=451379 RepID=A0A0N5APR1_9BILA